MIKSCIFSIITAVFSVTWSSEIIIICWFIINVGSSYAALYWGTCDTFLRILWLITFQNISFVLQYTQIFKHIQKFGVSAFFSPYFLKKLIFLFSKDVLNWSKVMVRSYIFLGKNILNKCCSFELFIHQRKIIWNKCCSFYSSKKKV